MAVVYNLLVANDNGNSEQKIRINGVLYRHPNIFVVNTVGREIGDDIEKAVQELHKNIDVEINSPALGAVTRRYLIGDAALSETIDKIQSIDVSIAEKYNEEIPVVNTLGILAVHAVKEHYKKNKCLKDGETIDLKVDMTTALPASVHRAETESLFANRFLDGLHKVTVFVKSISVNINVSFRVVKVLKEGVPALFTIIEDGKGNYRKDDMFAEFNRDYKKEVDGEYFLNKTILHTDIGDGTSELIVSHGYKVDEARSTGLRYGLGQYINDALVTAERLFGYTLNRQTLTERLKSPKKEIHRKKALNALSEPLEALAIRLFKDIDTRVKKLRGEIDVICVYGGASIVLKEYLYEKLKKTFEEEEIQILWIPAKYAVDMNVDGMTIYNDIKMETLIKQVEKM